MIKRKNCPVPLPDVRFAEVDGELLLTSAESEQALALNQSSTIIWKLCDGQATVDEIILTLQKAFPENSDDMSQQVNDTLAQLRDANLVFIRDTAD